METIYDGKMRTSSRQMYFVAGSTDFTWTEAFVDQTNGILGAAKRGLLTISTGAHGGYIGVRVAVGDAPPSPPGPEWEDVVEVSLFSLDSNWGIVEGLFGDGHAFTGGAEGVFRVRMSVHGMDEGAAADTVDVDEPLVEHHRLEIWPASWAPDEIIRRGSAYAERRHDDLR